MADESLGAGTEHDPLPPVDAAGDRPTVLAVQDVHLKYRIFSDRRPNTVGRSFVRAFKRRDFIEIHALRGVTFEVHEGESVGLIGRNGQGKTTLLKAIGGLLPLESGDVLARSEPVVLGVRGALHPELSGRRNVFLGGTAMGIPKEQLEVQFDDIVAFAGLEDFIELPLRAYSSGMAARLHFAVATAQRPDILCIDEALAVGDEEFRERSGERIKELTDAAGAVFLVTHSMATVQEFCERAIWIESGQVMADGPADDVVAAYHSFVRHRREHGENRGAGLGVR